MIEAFRKWWDKQNRESYARSLKDKPIDELIRMQKHATGSEMLLIWEELQRRRIYENPTIGRILGL